jgi:hypothetical protein
MIDRATPLTVTLSAQQWDAVLNALADGQFRVVQPLIAEIQRQCMQADVPADYHGYVDAMDQRGNGKAQEVQG